MPGHESDLVSHGFFKRAYIGIEVDVHVEVCPVIPCGNQACQVWGILVGGYDDRADFSVPIDLNADIHPFEEALGDKVTFVPRHRISWGGWAQVEYQKELLAAVLAVYKRQVTASTRIFDTDITDSIQHETFPMYLTLNEMCIRDSTSCIPPIHRHLPRCGSNPKRWKQNLLPPTQNA